MGSRARYSIRLRVRKPVAPSEREIEANLRSKPAKLRVIERKE